MPETTTETPSKDLVTEAVGVFHSVDALEAAVDALLTHGFDRAEVSLLASDDAVAAKLGHMYDKVQELEDDPNVPRAAYVGRDSVVEGKAAIVGGLAYIGALAAVGAVVASGGTLALTIAAAAIAGGGGGLIGSGVAAWLGQDRADHIVEQLRHGGLLLWVAVRDEAHRERATAILSEHGATDVHVHEMPRHTHPEGNPMEGVLVDPFLPGARI